MDSWRGRQRWNENSAYAIIHETAFFAFNIRHHENINQPPFLSEKLLNKFVLNDP